MTTSAAAGAVAPTGGIGPFEKWLSLWLALAIGAGLLPGNLVPGLIAVLVGWEVAFANRTRRHFA